MPERAVAALERFDLEERLLHGMQADRRFARGAFDRRDRLRADAADARDARARACAVEQHGAGAALPFAAAEAAAGQAEIVAEDRQQAVARLGVNLAVLAIDAQNVTSHERILTRLRPPTPVEAGYGEVSPKPLRGEGGYDARTWEDG